MKSLSNVLAIMWDTDPNKSLWTLLTKAWSTIRDRIGKERAPLDAFFRIMCPAMRIPSPQVYLERCGWTLVLDDAGAPNVTRDFELPYESFEEASENSTMSVADIIRHCHLNGYAQEYDLEAHGTPSTFHVNLNQPMENSKQVSAAISNQRIAMRNKRRAKRQQARDSPVLAMIQKQIDKAHAIPVGDFDYGDYPLEPVLDSYPIPQMQLPAFVPAPPVRPPSSLIATQAPPTASQPVVPSAQPDFSSMLRELPELSESLEDVDVTDDEMLGDDHLVLLQEAMTVDRDQNEEWTIDDDISTSDTNETDVTAFRPGADDEVFLPNLDNDIF